MNEKKIEQHLENYFQKYAKQMENYIGVIAKQHSHEIKAVIDLVQFNDEKQVRRMDKLESKVDKIDGKVNRK